MDDSLYMRAKAIFLAVCDLQEDERQPVLERECGDDAALLAEVRSLLDHYDGASETGTSTVFRSKPSKDHPSHVGPYRIIHELGRGGMGIVYLAARDDAPVRQRVAIKVLKRGTDTEEVIRRFELERQVLAALNHEGIARLYDAGETEVGLPYFVMEHVNGQPIDEYCDTNRLRIDERLQLFRKVCAAVHYAHQNLVVHRDLKPSNIVVTREGQPKLLDFGIAKLINPGLLMEAMDPTLPELRVMTPEYASPEQVRGNPISTASDVYSLGVVLYELLSGHRPYHLHSRMKAEIERVICEEDPERPSTALSRIDAETTLHGLHMTPDAVSKSRGAKLEQVRRRLAGDIDNIVLMAMRKEPQRRYASAEQLSDDIQRHLDGMPVRARTDTVLYRMSKFVQRNRGGVSAAAVIALLLVVGVILLNSARQEERDARVAAEVAEQAAAAAQLEAEQRKEEAETQAARAERRFAEGRQLVEFMLTDLHTMIQQLAGAMDARAALAREANAYLEQVTAEEPDNFESRFHLALACLRTAAILDGNRNPTQGDRDSADKWFEQAESRVASLRIEAPDDLDVMELQADLWTHLAEQARGGDEAIALCRDLVELRAEIRSRRPEIASDISYASALGELGRAFAAGGEMDAALAEYDRAASLLRRITGASGVPLARDTLGNTLIWTAGIHRERGDYERALPLYEEVIAIRQGLCTDYPDSARYKRRLAIAYSAFGAFYTDQGDITLAGPLLTDALRLRREAWVSEPGDARARSELIISHVEVGNQLVEEHDFERAIDVYRDGYDLSEARLRDTPGDRDLQYYAMTFEYGIADASRDLGRFGDVLKHGRAALMHLEQLEALDFDPNTAAACRGLVKFELGMALLETGPILEAGGVLREAIPLLDGSDFAITASIEARRALARLALRMESPIEARRYLAEAVERASSPTLELLCELAEAESASGDRTAALVTIDRALKRLQADGTDDGAIRERLESLRLNLARNRSGA